MFSGQKVKYFIHSVKENTCIFRANLCICNHQPWHTLKDKSFKANIIILVICMTVHNWLLWKEKLGLFLNLPCYLEKIDLLNMASVSNEWTKEYVLQFSNFTFHLLFLAGPRWRGEKENMSMAPVASEWDQKSQYSPRLLHLAHNSLSRMTNQSFTGAGYATFTTMNKFFLGKSII